MRIPQMSKNRFYFILIKWENAEKHIKEWEEEIKIQKYKEALGGQNE